MTWSNIRHHLFAPHGHAENGVFLYVQGNDKVAHLVGPGNYEQHDTLMRSVLQVCETAIVALRSSLVFNSLLAMYGVSSQNGRYNTSGSTSTFKKPTKRRCVHAQDLYSPSLPLSRIVAGSVSLLLRSRFLGLDNIACLGTLMRTLTKNHGLLLALLCFARRLVILSAFLV